jgi:hypothetical protein
VRTFCTVLSRADTARTRRRLLRLCARCRFAPRARRAARARHGGPDVLLSWLRPEEGGAHYAEPPPQRPARYRVPIRAAPPQHDRWAVIATVASGSRPEGPHGSGVNGWTPGPLRLLSRPLPAGQGPAADDTRLPLPPRHDSCRLGETSGARRLPEVLMVQQITQSTSARGGPTSYNPNQRGLGASVPGHGGTHIGPTRMQASKTREIVRNRCKDPGRVLIGAI